MTPPNNWLKTSTENVSDFEGNDVFSDIIISIKYRKFIYSAILSIKHAIFVINHAINHLILIKSPKIININWYQLLFNVKVITFVLHLTDFQLQMKFHNRNTFCKLSFSMVFIESSSWLLFIHSLFIQCMIKKYLIQLQSWLQHLFSGINN